jgi:mono/diheme cytochrome c family protein
VRYWIVGFGLGFILSGCDVEFEPPDQSERVAEATERLSPALFDSISWASEERRFLEGEGIYAAKCRRCHGTFGDGNTEYARERDLDVPGLVDPEWRWADSLEAARSLVFTGHENGMPIWGVAGISPREIDAVTYYVLFRLRPDILGDGTGH